MVCISICPKLSSILFPSRHRTQEDTMRLLYFESLSELWTDKYGYANILGRTNRIQIQFALATKQLSD